MKNIRLTHKLSIFALVLMSSFCVLAQTGGKSVYDEIKTLEFDGMTANVTDLVFKRDRVEMKFTGTIHFAKPVNGRVTAAVFNGSGRISADVPPSQFEKDNLNRLTGSEEFNTNFKTAVLRFSDDSFEVLGKDAKEGTPSAEAKKDASENEERLIKETGMNVSARLALSILNKEKTGVFIGTFDGGKLDRFTYVFDPQTRIPTAYFNINAGENGLIFSHDRSTYSNDVWLAFYELANYKSGFVAFSDSYNLIDISHYDMDIDLRDPKDEVVLKTEISFKVRLPDISNIPFYIGESLGEYRSQRLKKQIRIKSAKLGEIDLEFIQEDWESGFTLFFPKVLAENQEMKVTIELAGDYIRQDERNTNTHYPRSNSTWYPRHGELDRSTFDFRYLHPRKLKMASVGERISESPAINDKDAVLTVYKMKEPVALSTFAMGPFERHSAMVKWDDGSEPIELEFNSLPGGLLTLKESFVMAELDNSIRYFYALFGEYPYGKFSATYHPYGFGQGFASMLMIPGTDDANKFTYAFIAHETSHQWWGNIVAWRSYRDQWLSEGFAEYSGVLYTRTRDSPKAGDNLLKRMRKDLMYHPQNVLGLGKGRVNDLGPIIQGHRIESSKSLGAYSNLVYNKGGLILRMIHFLFTDPSTGDDKPFVDMMKDFVRTYKNKEVSTEDFRELAGRHFANTSIAKKYGLRDLNWFFRQWVYLPNLPSIRVEYSYQDNGDGSVMFEGEITQKDVDANWFMPIPITFRFGKDQVAFITLAASGEKTPFRVKLPRKPSETEIDSFRWLLVDDISSKQIKK